MAVIVSRARSAASVLGTAVIAALSAFAAGTIAWGLTAIAAGLAILGLATLDGLIAVPRSAILACSALPYIVYGAAVAAISMGIGGGYRSPASFIGAGTAAAAWAMVMAVLVAGTEGDERVLARLSLWLTVIASPAGMVPVWALVRGGHRLPLARRVSGGGEGWHPAPLPAPDPWAGKPPPREPGNGTRAMVAGLCGLAFVAGLAAVVWGASG